MRHLMRLKNKGFTLVELMVSIAVLGIVMSIIGLIINTSANTYGGITTDINLQYESQTAMSQLQEYILDCNGAIGIKKDPLNLKNELYIYHKNDDNSYNAYKFAVSPTSNVLLFYMNNNAPGNSNFDNTAPQPLSNFVQGFTADMSLNGRSIVITLIYKQGSRSYTGSQTITCRNTVGYISVP